jgi:hypothetical protein
MYPRFSHRATRVSTCIFLLSSSLCAGSLVFAAPLSLNTPCESLLKLKLPDTTITVAKSETGESYRRLRDRRTCPFNMTPVF